MQGDGIESYLPQLFFKHGALQKRYGYVVCQVELQPRNLQKKRMISSYTSIFPTVWQARIKYSQQYNSWQWWAISSYFVWSTTGRHREKPRAITVSENITWPISSTLTPPNVVHVICACAKIDPTSLRRWSPGLLICCLRYYDVLQLIRRCKRLLW